MVPTLAGAAWPSAALISGASSARSAASPASASSRACSTSAMLRAVSIPLSPPSRTGFSLPKLITSLPTKKVRMARKKNSRNGLT